jgi:hypothetical protein
MKSTSQAFVRRSAIFTLIALVSAAYDPAAGFQEPLGAAIDPTRYKAACPDYKNYAMRAQ